jgi:anaphase-promoting complex subunit 11
VDCRRSRHGSFLSLLVCLTVRACYSGMSSRKKRPSETMVIASNENNNNSALSATSAAMIPKIRLKVRLKRFHAVAAWSWNANDDVCGICQAAFEGVCPGVKYPGEDCPVVWGKCGHPFHLQCVSKWLSQPSSKNSCPICRQEWEYGQNPVAGETAVANAAVAAP